MSERITSELAYPSDGAPFIVQVIKNENVPPVIICDGEGVECPFKGRFHSAVTCALEIKSNPEQVNLCGKGLSQDY